MNTNEILQALKLERYTGQCHIDHTTDIFINGESIKVMAYTHVCSKGEYIKAKYDVAIARKKLTGNEKIAIKMEV